MFEDFFPLHAVNTEQRSFQAILDSFLPRTLTHYVEDLTFCSFKEAFWRQPTPTVK